jgi:hypothetical protein
VSLVVMRCYNKGGVHRFTYNVCGCRTRRRDRRVKEMGVLAKIPFRSVENEEKRNIRGVPAGRATMPEFQMKGKTLGGCPIFMTTGGRATAR